MKYTVIRVTIDKQEVNAENAHRATYKVQAEGEYQMTLMARAWGTTNLTSEEIISRLEGMIMDEAK